MTINFLAKAGFFTSLMMLDASTALILRSLECSGDGDGKIERRRSGAVVMGQLFEIVVINESKVNFSLERVVMGSLRLTLATYPKIGCFGRKDLNIIKRIKRHSARFCYLQNDIENRIDCTFSFQEVKKMT